MTSTSATGRIRIIKTPQGEAPEEVRQAWVGRILPCEPIVGFLNGTERGVLTGVITKKRYCYLVPHDQAIEVLELLEPKAAEWWKANGFPRPEKWFSFGNDEAEVVSGVIRQQILLVEDDVQGNPER